MIGLQQLHGRKTPGGHWRFRSEDIEALRQPNPARGRCGASPVLQNRRESLEELGLAVQELRGNRELRRLRREDAEERAQQEEDRADSRRQAQAEAERLRHQREEVEHNREIAQFRGEWVVIGLEQLPKDFPADRRGAVREALEAMPDESVEDPELAQPYIRDVLTEHESAWKQECQAADRKLRAQEFLQKTLNAAQSSLGLFASDGDRAEAVQLTREAIARLPEGATPIELKATVHAATKPVMERIEARRKAEAHERLMDRVVESAELKLILRSTKSELAGFRQTSSEILQALPAHAGEAEMQQAIQPIVAKLSTLGLDRQKHKQAHAHKEELILTAAFFIEEHLRKLARDGEISTDDLSDFNSNSDLVQAVSARLAEELTGEETVKEFLALVHEFVDEEV
jgi:hypothetical protein